MNERLQVSIDNLLEGVQILDREWRYLYVNSTAAAQGQSTREALIGRTLLESYPGIEQTAVFRVMQRVMNTSNRETLVNEFVFPSGERRWFELVIEPVPDGICVLSVDVTKRKESEVEVRRLQDDIESQRLRVFQATMRTVHDIVNNFLNNLQLVRLEAEGRLPLEMVTLFDEMIADASEKLRALGNLEKVTEKQMSIGVGIEYPGSEDKRT